MTVLRGSRCQCTVCALIFGNGRGFDAHRVGEIGQRRCLTANELIALEWCTNDQGVWLTPDPRRAGARNSQASGTTPATTPQADKEAA